MPRVGKALFGNGGHGLWEAHSRYSLVFPGPEVIEGCFVKIGQGLTFRNQASASSCRSDVVIELMCTSGLETEK